MYSSPTNAWKKWSTKVFNILSFSLCLKHFQSTFFFLFNLSQCNSLSFHVLSVRQTLIPDFNCRGRHLSARKPLTVCTKQGKICSLLVILDTNMDYSNEINSEDVQHETGGPERRNRKKKNVSFLYRLKNRMLKSELFFHKRPQSKLF